MIHGPKSAGLLFGRKDLITAARLNHSPNEAPIGRPMKVNKEEMFGMYAALKAYLEKDHHKEWDDWLQRAKRIGNTLETVSTVKTEVVVNPGPANAFPSLNVTWDQTKIKTNPKDVLVALKSGTPSIVANRHEDALIIGVVLLRPDQIDVVASRVKAILQQAV
jgi:seryl-tRNA(Sec) selenium transferase